MAIPIILFAAANGEWYPLIMSELNKPNEVRKANRIRSPAYPALGLRESIEKARILYQQFNRHPAPIQLISEAWSYAKQGSTGPLHAAALRRYGLLEKVATAKSNEDLKLTTSAIKILLAPEQNDEVRSLLKQAALKPKIFAELWRHYQGELPSDNVIQYYLLTEKGFNPDSVTYFIKIFKETIALANLGPDDKISDDDAPEDDKEREPEKTSNRMTVTTQDRKEEKQNPPFQSPVTSTLIEIPVPLPSGELAYYRVPKKMTEADFSFYTKLLAAYKMGLTGTDEEPPDPTAPGND